MSNLELPIRILCLKSMAITHFWFGHRDKSLVNGIPPDNNGEK